MDPIDTMYRNNRRGDEGIRAGRELCQDKDCTPIATAAIIGGVIAIAIPPNGAFIPLGAVIGSIIGFALVAVKKEIHRRN